MVRTFGTLLARRVLSLENIHSPVPRDVDMDTPDDQILRNRTDAVEFMKSAVEDGGSVYTPDTNPTNSVTYNDTNNNPVPLDSEQDRVGTYLADNFTVGGGVQSAEAVRAFQHSSHTGYLDIDDDVFKIRKGKSSDTSAETGDQLYREINDLGEDAPFSKRVKRMLVQSNRFNEDNKFVNANTNTLREQDSNLAISVVQGQLGKHNPTKFPANLDTASSIIELRNLKKIGMLMMLNGTGEVIIPRDPELTGFISTAVPGIARLGQRVPVSKFSAINAYKVLNPAFEKQEETDFIDGDKDKLSWGSVNNYAVMFAGRTSTPSVLSATFLMLTIGGLLKLVAAAFATDGTAAPINTQGTATERRRRLGSYIPVDPPSDSLFTLADFGLKLNIAKTRHDYLASVSRGINVFFGLGDDDSSFANPASLVAGVATSIAGGTPSTPIAQNHGYFNVVLRAVIKSASSFIIPGAEAISRLADNEGNSTENTEDALTVVDSLNPLAVFEKLNRSVLLQFLNILANIGDISLTLEDQGEGLDSIGEGLDGDSLGINPAVLQAKGRLNDGTLAYKQSSINSLFLMPPKILGAANRYDLNKPAQIYSAMATSTQLNYTPSANNIGASKTDLMVSNPDHLTNENRIKNDIVKKMEEYLERDYMPFWFQDLRTNEIISFHAFLDSVTDGYDTDYSESEGFGRVGKVMVYKNTNRNISLSFKILATGEDDFNKMWFKVNKLVTLVYPQWTKGREVKFGNNKFVQPFSQHPGASPMIRLRLGDIFKSNYSKFALARLFGFSEGSDFNLEGITAQPDGSSTYATQNTITTNMQTMRDRMRNTTPDPGQGFQTGERAYLAANRNGPGNTVSREYRRSPNLPNGTLLPGLPVRATPESNRLVINTRLPVTVQGRNEYGYTVRIINATGEQDALWNVEVSALSVDETYVSQQAYRDTVANSGANDDHSESTTTADAIGAFVDPNNNPVFKAFDSTSGTGLAGFIKSLHFDFNEASWVTDEYNSRAPMLISVNLEFAPIHDLHPGIDHHGFNTAPIYNVGGMMASFGYDKQNDYDQRKLAFNASRRPLGRIAVPNS